MTHDDPLNDLFNAGATLSAAPHREPPASYTPPSFEETCGKCGGSGKFTGYSGRVVGNCFTCKGTGKKVFRTSREDRARSAVNSANRRAANAKDNVNTFKAANPDIYAWMVGNPGFAFAVSLLEGVKKYGDLTENQKAAAERCVTRDLERQAAREARAQVRQTQEAEAPVINVQPIFDALTRARQSTGKRPKLYIQDYRFKFAPDHGRNAGGIYVTNKASDWLGTIKAGKFIKTDKATQADIDALIAIAVDPRAAAIAHGFKTKNCACCGRLLTDPVSVANGIGPICATGFGW